MNQKLAGKIALVTGGSAGIGLGAAKRFAAEGARVFITGRDPAKLALATAEIGHGAIGLQGDSSNLADIDRIYATIREEAGHLDVLLVNAGFYEFGTFGEITEDHFDKTFNTNVRGVLFAVQKALPLLPNGASVILTGSIASNKGFPSFSVYNASKAFVVSFTQALQGEVAGSGVLVQVVTPPAVDTDFWNKAGLPVSNLPAGSVMKPQHMVDAALKGLDRGESWVFPSLPDQALWNDYEKSRQALVGGLMNGAPAVRYAA